MSGRGTLLAVVAVVVGVALVAVPVLGAVGGVAPVSGGPAAAQTNGTNETTSGNVSLGTRIASFMQANSAATDSSVEAGMWAAKYNQSGGENRSAVVRSRIDRLERRSERLRERMATLQTKYENDEIPRVAYVAQASRLTAKLEGLREAINETDERAQAVGVNASQLDRLRTQARNMSGQEVAAVARGLAVVRPDHAGPPADAGPPEDAGPGDAGPPEDAGPGQSGPPDDVGPSKNLTDSDQPGPPGDRGRNGPPGDREGGPPTDGGSPVDRQSNASDRNQTGSNGGNDDGTTDTTGDAEDTVDDAEDTAGDGGGRKQSGPGIGGKDGGPPGR